MVRFFTSLLVTVVIITTVLRAWAPTAKGQTPFTDCLDFCEEQAICQCAKWLGGSLRLTKCNIGATCIGGEFCECEVDPICAPWEKDVVVQSFPIEPPEANNCD